MIITFSMACKLRDEHKLVSVVISSLTQLYLSVHPPLSHSIHRLCCWGAHQVIPVQLHTHTIAHTNWNTHTLTQHPGSECCLYVPIMHRGELKLRIADTVQVKPCYRRPKGAGEARGGTSSCGLLWWRMVAEEQVEEQEQEKKEVEDEETQE